MIPVTSLYAALAAVFLIALSIHVVLNRYRTHVSIGSQDDRLTRAIRVQANFTEYVPMILILMSCAELFKGSVYLLHIAGIAMLIGRACHAYSLLVVEPKYVGTNKGFTFRMIGMILTFAVLGVLAVWLLYTFFLYYTRTPG